MALVVAIVVGGCAVADPILKPGWRHIIVPVENEMARPVFVVVARNQMPPITVVGTAEPGTVPAGQTVDVSLGLPPDPDRAIYVNPGPNQGAMFLPGDIPRRLAASLVEVSGLTSGSSGDGRATLAC